MNVYPLTRVDRDLLLAGADLEAVLADREKEKLERNGRTQARFAAESRARVLYLGLAQDEDRGDRSELV